MEDRVDYKDPFELVDRYEELKGRGLTDFFYPLPAPRTTWKIIRWWESRRLKYNLIVGGTGLLSLGVIRVMTSLPPDPIHIPYVIQPIIAFGALANICYLLGPAGEILVEKVGGGKILPTGPSFWRMGLTFSVGLTLLPTLIVGMGWVFRILSSVF
jgi:hypothetical protein